MLLAVFFVATLIACDRNDPGTTGVIPVSIRPVLNAELFETETVYQNLQGRSFEFEGLSLYVSDLTLVKEDGEEVIAKSENQEEAVLFFDFGRGEVYGTEGSLASNGALVSGNFDIPAGAYQGVKLTLGVPRNLNGDFDPVTYSVDHPLSEQRGAFWSWNSGYIFLKIDGRFDNSPEGNGQDLLGSLTYHTGLDSLIRTVSFLEPEHAFTIETGDTATDELSFTLDVNKLFYLEGDTLDMMDSNLTHTTNDFDLAKTIMDNLAAHAISLE